MTVSQMSTSTNDVHVVPLDACVFAVHLDTPAGRIRIGQVTSQDEQRTWQWQHRDGERSSPITSNVGDIVRALAQYHGNFKAQPDPVPTRRLLFRYAGSS
jgi:hypothetical protein